MVISFGLVLGLALTAGEAAAAPAVKVATVKITISTPSGVPANVLIHGTKTAIDAAAAKDAAGKKTTIVLKVPAGSYTVSVPVVTVNGSRYVLKKKAPTLKLKPGKTTRLKVALKLEPGARDLALTDLTETSVGLRWDGPAKATYVVRRGDGDKAPAKPTEGTSVAVKPGATTVTDSTVKAGTRYSYALFTRVKKHSYGPLVLSVATPHPKGTIDTSFVVSPDSLVATKAQISSASTSGDDVMVTLAPGTRTPVLGAGVVLPPTSSLPGGFLGAVRSVGADGRSVVLEQGSLDDVFDYYHLSVPAFTSDPGLLPVAEVKTTLKAEAAGRAAHARAIEKRERALGRSATRSAKSKLKRAETIAPKRDAQRQSTSAKLLPCPENGIGNQDVIVDFTPKIAVGGSFSTTVNKFNTFLGSIPVGASVDVSAYAKLTGAATVESTTAFSCALDLPSLPFQIAEAPVPIALKLSPVAEFEVGGTLKLANVGATVTGGFQVSGSMSVAHGASFSGAPILHATPLVPKVTAGGGELGLSVGGKLLIGPGVANAEAGVIAGISGEFDLLKAEVKFTVTAASNVCSSLDAGFADELGLTVSVWLDHWTFQKSVTADGLSGSWPYPGFPVSLPEGCENEATPDSVLGTGVTSQDETTSGSPTQWGHVDGFVPGQKAWVLSTGNIADAVGSPEQFASTDLGNPGDADLSALAGYDTYDAAYFETTLVPTGSTLHVRYAFASEEYPEYVGSSYNDVMAVYVDGQNCAVVPGTDLPVSVNTVNAASNSQYYVDNSSGAAGYQTSLDGLTVPLTCSVPVTPGHPVTVKIAVADTSDHIYDSAVALVDGGIWSD